MSKNIYEYNDEQQKLLDDLQKYIDEHGVPNAKDFRLKNGLRSFNYYKKTFNKTHLKDILALAGVKTSEKYNIMHYSINKNLNDDDLLEILKEYSNKFGFPTQRQFKSKNGLPSYTTYVKRFGSFKDAIILAGIEIPKDRKWLFQRESLTDEEIKEQMKYFIENYIEKENKLPTYEVINNQKNIPSASVIDKRFGSLSKLLSILGYDINHNDNIFKDKLMNEYICLAKKLDRTPTSRDLDEYSILSECCSASTYIHHFGSIYNVQLLSGYQPVNIGRNKTDAELIEDIKTLADELDRAPLQKDFTSKNGVASIGVYNDRFGNFHNALKLAGFSDDEIGYKTYTTKKGTLCLSLYEYRFACLLESKNIHFEKELPYKDFIEDLNKKYRFDFLVNYENRIYFVEIFGVIGNTDYDLRTMEKIKLCKDNNIPLISLYPDIFWSTTQSELFFYLQEKMKEIDELHYK